AEAQAPDTEVFIVDTFQDLVDYHPNGICSAGQDTGGPCSLRAAVTDASQVMVVGRNLHIQLPYGTYVLTQNDPSSGEDAYYGDLDFKDLPEGFSGNERTVTIEGMGVEPSVIDANGIDRVLEIGRDYNVILKNLVITGGKVVANANETGLGGGILNMYDSSLELDKVRITDNKIVCNECDGASGGGIYSMSKLTIRNSEIDHNTAENTPAMECWSSTPVLIRNSAIHSNYSELGRPPIACNGLLLNLVNSTVEGKIYWIRGDVWIQNSTLYNFEDSYHGRGNIMMESPDTEVELKIKNSILVTQDKDDPGATRGPNCTFSEPNRVVKTSHGGNVFSDDTCPFDNNLDIRVGSPLDARLGPLQNNGGRTPTRALLPGSPAIDRRNGLCQILLGTPAKPSSSLLLEDQRRVDRDLKCDSGAFEDWPPAFTLLPMILR
ncbi:MAG: choice-of-anchor Q domain-containing protein, partial [Anaerolineaceae bacterium]